MQYAFGTMVRFLFFLAKPKTKFMKSMTSIFRKLLVTACAALTISSARAAIFTAVASGNFTSSTTWGGLVPGSLISTDVIIIPAGIDVVLDADAVFSGSSSLMVNGSFTSAGSSALVVTSGALSGSGTIDVDSMALGLTTGFSFTGSIWTNKFTSTGTSISTAANIWVRNTLALSAGAMDVTAGSITLFNNSTVLRSGGSIMASGTGSLMMDSVYNVVYTSASATTGAELSGSGLNNVTVNLAGNVTMSSDLTMHGDLILSSGTLMLNSHKLTIGADGNIVTTGSGSLAGNTTSDLEIMSAGSITGTLAFGGSGNALRHLTINMGTGSSTVSLGNTLMLAGNLNLQRGRLVLGANDLHINAGGMLMGGSSSSYVVAGGTGRLVMNLTAGATDTFEVGTASHYSPVVVRANSGSASGDVSVNVAGSVYANGTSGAVLSATEAMVSSTWHVSSTATAAINYDMWVSWDASMEVNGFNRANAYISHYTAGSWDAHAPAAATASGSMYTMSRMGLTSLSPFMVADNTFGTTGIAPVASVADVSIYPNPVVNTLHFSSGSFQAASIYNAAGQLVQHTAQPGNTLTVDALPAGLYVINLAGANGNVTKTFVKE